jgi:hypothetical protein
VKYSKGLKCTSWTLVIWGAIGVVMSIYHGFNARHEAHHILHRGPMHQKGSPPSGHDGNKPVTESEFAVYDIIKTLSVISFFMSLALLHMGK